MREIAAARERDDQEHDRDIRAAWLTVRIYAEWRTKKLPTLKSLLERTHAKKGGGKRQTVEEQRAVLHTLSKMFGGKVREHGRK